jgi:hypothetical protein
MRIAIAYKLNASEHWYRKANGNWVHSLRSDEAKTYPSQNAEFQRDLAAAKQVSRHPDQIIAQAV